MRRLSEFKIAKLLCHLFDHKWDEFHMYEVCSRCRTCREYTKEDVSNFERKKLECAELKGKSQA